jgi:hypothetical protein
VRSAEAFASIAQERFHGIRLFYISALQVAQCQRVLNQIWNGMVPVAETKSIHAVMLIALFAIEYQYYLFPVKKYVHTFQKKTHVRVHRNLTTILPHAKVILSRCPVLKKEVS